jgi:hypothetical protein
MVTTGETVEITTEQVVEAVEAFLTDNPNVATYVDIVNRDGDQRAVEGLEREYAPMCFYRTADRTKPLCIVGQVLDRLGMPTTEADEHFPADVVLAQSPATFTAGAVRFLTRMQQDQDNGGYLDVALALHR